MSQGSAQDRARHELPHAGQGRIEVHHRCLAEQIHVVQKGQDAEHGHNGGYAKAVFGAQPQYQRKENIELFLNAQAPQVQQRLELAGHVEIAGFPPENEVGNERRATEHVFAQCLVFIGQEGKPAEGHDRQQHQNERWEDTADTAVVESRYAELPLLQILHDNGGNEIAGYDKEDIHTNETATQGVWEGVEGHDAQHGKSPQTINVRSIGKVDGALVGTMLHRGEKGLHPLWYGKRHGVLGRWRKGGGNGWRKGIPSCHPIFNSKLPIF